MAKVFRTLLIAGLLTNVPAGAGLWDQTSIPETPVKLVGEVDLSSQGRVELAFDEKTPGVGEVSWMHVSPDSSLLIVDDVAGAAHEFDLHGHYVRSFGGQGEGPGEFRNPCNIWVDPNGRVYLLHEAGIIRYDRFGNLESHTTDFEEYRVLAGRGGEVFLLGVQSFGENRLMSVSRLDPKTWDRLYITPLSTKEEHFLSDRMGSFFHLCYSVSRHRLYYMGVNDYHVQEIDADTGRVVRVFGLRPEGYAPLPEEFHTIGRGSMEWMGELQKSETSMVKSMTLFHDRYLFISHDTDSIVWTVYDLDGSSLISAYGLRPSAAEQVESLADYTPWNSITAWGHRLLLWRPPAKEEADVSNGSIEMYEVSFQ